MDAPRCWRPSGGPPASTPPKPLWSRWAIQDHKPVVAPFPLVELVALEDLDLLEAHLLVAADRSSVRDLWVDHYLARRSFVEQVPHRCPQSAGADALAP